MTQTRTRHAALGFGAVLLLMGPWARAVTRPAGPVGPEPVAWSCLEGVGPEGAAASAGEYRGKRSAPERDLSVAPASARWTAAPTAVEERSAHGCLLPVRWSDVVQSAASETVALGAAPDPGSGSDEEPPICTEDGARCTSVPVDLPPGPLVWKLHKGDCRTPTGGFHAPRGAGEVPPRVLGAPRRGYPSGPFEPPRD